MTFQTMKLNELVESTARVLSYVSWRVLRLKIFEINVSNLKTNKGLIFLVLKCKFPL